MLDGAVHRWEMMEFGTLDGMNDGTYFVTAYLRPRAGGLGVVLQIGWSGGDGLFEERRPPLGGNIAIRLHTAESVEDAVPLRPQIFTWSGNGLGGGGEAEVVFAWRKGPPAAGVLEFSTDRQTYLLAVPYGFLNGAQDGTPEAVALQVDAVKLRPALPRANRIRHLLPQWVRYPKVSLPGEITLELAQRNPFEGITELRITGPAFDTVADDMMHTPRTSLVLYVNGQQLVRSRCTAILRSELENRHRRVDRHILFTRGYRIPSPSWGELAVEIDDAEVRRDLMPASMFAYGQGLPGDAWIGSPGPYHEGEH